MTMEAEGPDLVVAGAGGGLVAALRAAELGLSVLVVERNEHFAAGNNTSMSTAMIPGAGSRWQREEGIEDSVDTFIGDVQAKTRGEADPVVTRALAEVSAPLVEWMADSLRVPLTLVTDFHYPGHSVQRCHSIEGRAGRALLQHLLRRVRESELIDLLVPARLTDVAVGPDGVEAVTIEGPGGSERIPTRAVLLATNGFGADAGLVGRHIPEISEAIYHGSEGSTGDALRIGERLGAATGFLDAYQGHAALAMPAATLAGWATVMHGGFLVDRTGRRFGDETTGYSEYAAQVLENAQDGEAWIVLDERIHEACLEFQDYRDVVSSGGVRWASTVDELADAIGVDRLGLGETVEEARAGADGAEDPFGRRTWSTPLTPPFGAVFVKPALFHTQGGLRVDEQARVTKADGTSIPGLYAAGGAAVGISGHGAGGYLAGNGLLSAFGLSYLAASDAAATRHP
ncbi:FAD-binding protein [Aeromicrobium sp. YIM 150415]|uniref:FAD-dependent oxidoreductase n=1 Tax=Aeromicrobium sp. YIM 150415 TaxID=2803912 RepID=UPI001F0659F1|nr:FAD-binding protein [Aeromicrobium sp. YIM 150415]